ncbi:hypothetical protein TL16_g12142 [Triparma laevis f. inornata]|uniref:Uncharacterized protein n=1 Tax=Triparma laevis f. inornata TaxID=1714386 RepID=A0A9W7ET29_9STRA|nr:hypothetical protein TL16_g12142 [Triparma laevis f. inornata]
MDGRSVKYETKDNKFVLLELLRLRLRCEVLLSGNNFLGTDDYRRLLVELIPDDTLMAMRVVSKSWLRVVTGVIDDSVESGAMIVHAGNDISLDDAYERVETRNRVTRVHFLPNIMQIGYYAACDANLVVIEITEGLKWIGTQAFSICHSLTTVYFTSTLKLIGVTAFGSCSSLDNVDLIHTNLEELGEFAFCNCSELKSMTIPDSLQKLGDYVFYDCYKLVPSNIVDDFSYEDVTPQVVAHLRSLQN